VVSVQPLTAQLPLLTEAFLPSFLSRLPVVAEEAVERTQVEAEGQGEEAAFQVRLALAVLATLLQLRHRRVLREERTVQVRRSLPVVVAALLRPVKTRRLCC